ncbi:MAG TPA: hypothetical protein VF635_08425 [Propionibacteriaceae bacterium]|jgi:hypothetical protein
MKLTRVVPAIAALALSSTVLLSPAYATAANGLSASNDKDKGGKSEVINEHVNVTQNFGKNEVCTFPASIKFNIHVRYVITNNGDDVAQTSRGHVKVTNRDNDKSLRLKVDSKAYIKVDHDDDIAGVGYGKDAWYNAASNSLKVTDGHRHVSAANRAHQKNEGIYAIQGKHKFSVENVSSTSPRERVNVKHGRVLDVCAVLAGRHKHHDHH